uniref:Integrase catalytic domain-containing protein n=1 Tax=Meloidogyne incognita TaxID=6306 RepID=A0A914KQM5_MELIC
MPIHPMERVRKSRPFSYIGVDYLGPSLCKINGEKVKFWIALFTCFCTRAIHLEITLDISALSFLHILRRFVAQRGAPSKILSDNGNQFIVISKAIGAEITGKWGKEKNNEESLLRNFLLKQNIEWKFIPSLSPWQGAIYERIVKLVKDCFKKSLGNSLLDLEELKTFVKEAEMVVNSRPITLVSLENDGPVALRPIDFLVPTVEENLALKEPTELDFDEFKIGKLSTAEQIQHKWKLTLKTLNRFWERWNREYMIILRDKSQWTHNNGRSSSNRKPEIGEVVIVHQEGQPRNTWPLGKIIELDGIPPKCAKIKIGNKTLVRPINKISPLEAKQEKNDDEEKTKDIELDKNKKDEIIKNKLDGKNDKQIKNNNQRIINNHPMMTRAKTLKELCCMGSCLVEINSIEQLKFRLPKDITALNYNCRATYWSKRNIYRNWISCNAVDPCKRVEGFRERLFNPQCESMESLILVGIFLGLLLSITLMVMLFVCKFLLIFGKIIKYGWKAFYSLKLLFKTKETTKYKDKGEKPLINRDKIKKVKKFSRNRRLNKLNLLRIAPLIIFLINYVKTEVEVVVVQAKTEDCFRKKGSSVCTINAVNTVTLLPDAQIISLSLKNGKGTIMGELQLSMNGLLIECNQKILKYLRSYETKIESVMRCPASGTCKASRCNHIRTKENVEELMEWNKYPGNSFCMEGSSLWGYQCTLPGAACYFYRVYAMPKSEERFKLISCPTWDYSIELDIEFIIKGNSTKQRFTLNPGMTFKWQNIKFTLIDITPPMAPILNSEFIIGEKGIAISEQIKTSLDCGSYNNFSKCILDTDSCNECWLDQEQDRVSCSCSDFIVEDLINDPKKSLPLDSSLIKLRSKGNKIVSESHYLPIQLMIS